MLNQSGVDMLNKWAEGRGKMTLDRSTFAPSMLRTPGYTQRATMEIRVSKLACKLCSIFIDVVSNKSPLNVVIRSTHGWVYPRWSLPTNVPPLIEEGFLTGWKG
ncbi:hypothetical protein BDD12DRAFT_184407 [Trichophaea hybrida]|nr:hypothetical protein BDD12DRAFT_184407 [Trichophaea hybrida]